MPSTIFWKGNAPTLTAQVSRVTFGTYDVTTTRTITIGTSSISAADSGGNLTAALTALAVLLNASTDYYFEKITWTSDGTHIIGTSDTAGVGIIFSGAVAGGTGTYGGYSTTTANSGPCDLGTAANYSGNVVPVTGDTLIFSDNSVNVAYTLDALSAVTLAVLRIEKTYTGLIGLPETQHATSTDGLTADTSYAEVRPQYMKLGATICNLGQNFSGKSQTGSGRIKIDLQNITSTCTVYDTASTGSDANLPPVQLLALKNDSDLNIIGGNVGLCVGAGEVSTIRTVTQAGGTFTSGVGMTATTIKTEGGTSNIAYTAIANVYTYGGVTTITGTAAISSGTNCLGGTLYWNTSGDAGALVINDGGTFSSAQTGLQVLATTLAMGHCGFILILNPAGISVGGSSVTTFSGPVRIVTTRA